MNERERETAEGDEKGGGSERVRAGDAKAEKERNPELHGAVERREEGRKRGNIRGKIYRERERENIHKRPIPRRFY